MFVGHLAAALGAKSVDRRLPLALLIAASFGVDLLWPVFLLAGIEFVEIDPGNTAFTPLAFVSYPWTHSLLLVIAWAGILGIVAHRFGISTRGAFLTGAVVVSHWVLDLFTHRPDLPLWPGGPLTGLGLWNSIAGTLVIEGLLLAGGVWLFYRSVEVRNRKGTLALWSLLVLTVVIWASQPWSPPAPNVSAVAMVGLAMWLLPLWGMWIDRNTSPRPE